MSNYTSQEMGGQFENQQKQQFIQQNQTNGRIGKNSTNINQIRIIANNNNVQQNINKINIIQPQNQKNNQQQNQCFQTPEKSSEQAFLYSQSGQIYPNSNYQHQEYKQYQQQSKSEIRFKIKQQNNPVVELNQKLQIFPLNNNQTNFYEQKAIIQPPHQSENSNKVLDNQFNKIKIVPKQNNQQAPLSHRQTEPQKDHEDSNQITKSMFIQQQIKDMTKPTNDKKIKQIKLLTNQQEKKEECKVTVGIPSGRDDVQEIVKKDLVTKPQKPKIKIFLNENKIPSPQPQQLQPFHYPMQLPINQAMPLSMEPINQALQQPPQQPSATTYLQENVVNEELDLELTEYREQSMQCHFCGHLTSNYLNLSCSHCIHQLCLTSKFSDFIRKKTEGYISCLCGQRIGNTLLRAIINDEQFKEYLERQAQWLVKEFRDEYGWTD